MAKFLKWRCLTNRSRQGNTETLEQRVFSGVSSCEWLTDMLSCLLDGRLRIWIGHWLTGLFSAVASKLLTTAVKQMGAITNISQFSSSCSFCVNTAVIHGTRDTQPRNTNAAKLNLSGDLSQMRDACTGLTWAWPGPTHCMLGSLFMGATNLFLPIQLLINYNQCNSF